MKTNIKMKAITILITLLTTIQLNAQYVFEGERNFGGTLEDNPENFIITSDNGFILVGMSFSDDIDATSSYQNGDIWIVKLDSVGVMEWEKTLGGSDMEADPSIKQTTDKGYILSATTYSNDFDISNNNGISDIWIVKLDSLGNIEWEKTLGGSNTEYSSDINLTDNKGYIVAAWSGSSNNGISNYGNGDSWMVKLDSIGNIEWENNYGGSGTETTGNILNTSDNGYIFSSKTGSWSDDVSNLIGSQDVWLVKIDSLGNIQWEKTYGGTAVDEEPFILESMEGGYIVSTTTNSSNVNVSNNNGAKDIWIFKIDDLGNLEWENNYGGTLDEKDSKIVQKTNGNYVMGCRTKSSDIDISYAFGDWDNWIIEIDTLGNVVWESNFGSTSSDKFVDIQINNKDEIFFIYKSVSGYNNNTNSYGDLDYWITKLIPAIGNVSGNVYLDYNNDCVFNTADSLLPNFIIQSTELNNSNNVQYSLTNMQAFYSLSLDTVSQSITYFNPSPYFESSTCSQDTQIANLSISNLKDTVNFYLTPTQLCPYLTIDIANAFLRRCFDSDYNISYCNSGSVSALNAYVEIEFDPILQVNSSSIPWTTVIGNTYTFPIGDVGIFECGNFSVNVTIPCDTTTFLGEVLCTEAHIFPDTFCMPTPNWTGADLKAKATCLGTDSVEFVLKNIGYGDMGGDETVIVIEDVILRIDTMATLNAGDSLIWVIPNNGMSQRIIAQQPVSHPFKTFTTASVNLCNKSSFISPGPIVDTTTISFPNDEEAPFIAIDCQPIIGSFDPNDKTVYPTGVGANHFITETTDLEYKIRFQNTGTDTAFLVVITDSISNNLDITSIQPGASSHPYQFDIYGTGVVKFTFNNILLPDSFVNEPASNGFVQYKIKQKAGNQVGDLILNNADIFFDFNLPIRTNTAYSEIGGVFLDTIIYKFPSIVDGVEELENYEINVYPNPGKDVINFEFESNKDNISIELYDLSGKLQQKAIGVNSNKVQIRRNGLNSGMYIFKIYSDGKEIAYGKLIFN